MLADCDGEERYRVGSATEEYEASFFANGAALDGVLERPGMIKDSARVRESWQSTFGGSRNPNKIVVLAESMKYAPICISPEQAQFLETRKFQINEIFRIPPHMVDDLCLVNSNMLPLGLSGAYTQTQQKEEPAENEPDPEKEAPPGEKPPQQEDRHELANRRRIR